jgi:prenyltransferase beta subunit
VWKGVFCFGFGIFQLSKEIMMFRRILALILVVSLMSVLPVWAQEDNPGAKAVRFLQTVQNEDGGFSNGVTLESDLTATADAVIAAASAEEDPQTVFSADPVAYLEARVEAGDVTAAGQIAKVITAAVAAGLDPADFGETDLTKALLALQADDGVIGMGAFDHCLSMIALENAGVELIDGTVAAAVAAQNEDGGWGFMAGEASDTNTTGLCLQALASTDATDSIDAGLAYLKAIQNEDGGWPYQSPSDYGTDSDTNSTALVVQALIANDEDLTEWNNPQTWLLSMQNDSGSFSFQAAMPGDNVLATLAAIPAIEGVALNAWMPKEME